MKNHYTVRDQQQTYLPGFLCAFAPLRETILAGMLAMCVAARCAPRTGIAFAGRTGQGRATPPAFPPSGATAIFSGGSRCRVSAIARPSFGAIGCFSCRPIGDRRADRPGIRRADRKAAVGAALRRTARTACTSSTALPRARRPSTPSTCTSCGWPTAASSSLRLTHDGDEVWRRDAGSFSEKHGFGKSPVVVDDVVCVANDNEGDERDRGLRCRQRRRRAGNCRALRPAQPPSPRRVCSTRPQRQKLLLTVSTATGLAAIDAATGEAIVARAG